jgi:hypothetical protein
VSDTPFDTIESAPSPQHSSLIAVLLALGDSDGDIDTQIIVQDGFTEVTFIFPGEYDVPSEDA